MSTKVQPANDAGNDASEPFEADGDEGVFSEKNRAACLRRSEATRAEWLASSSDATPGVLVVHFENIPDAARGPTVMSAYSQVEWALQALARNAHFLVSQIEDNPAIHWEIAGRISEAARTLETIRPLPVFVPGQPSPRFVLDLFDAALVAVQRVVASDEHDERGAVLHVARAVATLRSTEEFCSTVTADVEAREVTRPRRSVEEIQRVAYANARAFERWFIDALSELRAMSGNAPLLARAQAMSHGFPGNNWPCEDTIRKLIRGVRATVLTPIELHRFELLVREIVEYSRLPDLMSMRERGASVQEEFAYLRDNER